MRVLLLLLLFLPVHANNVTCAEMRTIYMQSDCCANNGNAKCLQAIPDCGGCTDNSKATETECLSPEDVTSGTPLASTNVNYLTKSECMQFFSGSPFTVTGLNGNSVDPHGCFRKTSDTQRKGYFNEDTGGSGVCFANKPCIQKSANAWSGSTPVEAGEVCVDANNKIVVKGLSDAFDFSNANHIKLKKSVIPDANNAYDFGNAEYKIRDIYEAD